MNESPRRMGQTELMSSVSRINWQGDCHFYAALALAMRYVSKWVKGCGSVKREKLDWLLNTSGMVGPNFKTKQLASLNFYLKEG